MCNQGTTQVTLLLLPFQRLVITTSLLQVITTSLVQVITTLLQVITTLQPQITFPHLPVTALSCEMMVGRRFLLLQCQMVGNKLHLITMLWLMPLRVVISVLKFTHMKQISKRGFLGSFFNQVTYSMIEIKPLNPQSCVTTEWSCIFGGCLQLI